MKNMLKIEFSRAFKSIGFYLALLIGGIIAAVHCALEVIPYAFQLDEYVAMNLPMMYPGWLYSSWIGGNVTMSSFLLFLILPILASLPHGDTFFTDAKSGFIHNLCIRADKKHYYIAKYISAFLSGGIAVIFPLVLNFYLSSLFLPAMKPEVSSFNTLLGENSSFPHLYFSYPFLYVILFLGIIFIFSGLFSTVSLLSSYYVRYRFLVLVFPFIIYLFLVAFFNLLGFQNWQPTNFLHPAYQQDSAFAIIIEIALLLIITVYGFIIKSAKEDIY